jgi:hypothetical protein
MIHHISITTHHPLHVSQVLVELLAKLQIRRKSWTFRTVLLIGLHPTRSLQPCCIHGRSISLDLPFLLQSNQSSLSTSLLDVLNLTTDCIDLRI